MLHYFELVIIYYESRRGAVCAAEISSFRALNYTSELNKISTVYNVNHLYVCCDLFRKSRKGLSPHKIG